MGCGVVLIVALLCILQCEQYQAQNGNTKDALYQIRVPVSAIRNQQPCRNNIRYPYFSQFLNSCKNCPSSICNKTCTNTGKQLSINLSQKPIGISIPSGKSTINLVLNYKPKPISKQIVNVEVKVKPKQNNTSNDTSSVSSTANSTASKDKDGEKLTADTTASVSDVEFEIIIRDVSSGGNSVLKSSVVIIDSNGNRSGSQTKAEVDEKPKNKSHQPRPDDTSKPAAKPAPASPPPSDDGSAASAAASGAASGDNAATSSAAAAAAADGSK